MFSSNLSQNTVHQDLDDLKTFSQTSDSPQATTSTFSSLFVAKITNYMKQYKPYRQLGEVPIEIIIYIFEYHHQTLADLIRMSGVNKQWRAQFTSDSFCKQLLFSKYPEASLQVSSNFHRVYLQTDALEKLFLLQYKNTFKLMVCGNFGVGKSSFVMRFILDQYMTNLDETLDDEYTKLFDYDGKSTRLYVLDMNINAYDEYDYMTGIYLRDRHTVMICFSLADPSSFVAVQKDRIWEIMADHERNLVPIMLIGLQSDNKSSGIDFDGIKEFCSKKKLEYIETSAKDGINVDLAFAKALDLIHLRYFDWKVLQDGSIDYCKEYLRQLKSMKKKNCILS